MSLIVRLRDYTEALAGSTSTGTPMGRAAVALELVAGVTTYQSYPERIRAACRAIAINGGKTPTGQGKSAFVESAENLELAYETSSQASPIERMILSIKPFVDLLAQSTIAGTPALPWANDSEGNRESAIVGGDVRATNLALWSEDQTNVAWSK